MLYYTVLYYRTGPGRIINDLFIICTPHVLYTIVHYTRCIILYYIVLTHVLASKLKHSKFEGSLRKEASRAAPDEPQSCAFAWGILQIWCLSGPKFERCLRRKLNSEAYPLQALRLPTLKPPSKLEASGLKHESDEITNRLTCWPQNWSTQI